MLNKVQFNEQVQEGERGEKGSSSSLRDRFLEVEKTNASYKYETECLNLYTILKFEMFGQIFTSKSHRR